jgi:hypothetical protein
MVHGTDKHAIRYTAMIPFIFLSDLVQDDRLNEINFRSSVFFVALFYFRNAYVIYRMYVHSMYTTARNNSHYSSWSKQTSHADTVLHPDSIISLGGFMSSCTGLYDEKTHGNNLHFFSFTYFL